MGILPFQAEGRKYWMELDIHPIRRKTELPVETLGAIFLESNGMHPITQNDIATLLNEQGIHASPAQAQHAAVERVKDIIKRAKQSGTEIWLGDVLNRRHTNAVDKIKLLAGTPFTLWLGRKGNASRRVISRKATSALNVISPHRDLAMAHKINALAKITGHTNIGIYAGAGHARIADLLKTKLELTKKDKEEITKYDGCGVQMFRCSYDKTAEKWRVEEHRL